MTLDTDMLVKIAAGIGALILAAPSLFAAIRGALRPVPAPAKDGGVLVLATAPTAADVASRDAHLILDVAERLRAAGNIEGAKLAHQLIDVVLATPTPKG